MKSLTLLDYFSIHDLMSTLEKSPMYGDLIKSNRYENAEIAIDGIDKSIQEFQSLSKNATIEKYTVFYNKGYHLILKVYDNTDPGVSDYFYALTLNTTLELLGCNVDNDIFKILDNDGAVILEEEVIQENNSPLSVFFDESDEAEKFLSDKLQQRISFNRVLSEVTHFKEVSYKKYIQYFKHYCEDEEYLSELSPMKKRFLFKLFPDNTSTLFYDFNEKKAVRMEMTEGILNHDLITYKIRNFEDADNENNFGIKRLSPNKYIIRNDLFDKSDPDFLVGESSLIAESVDSAENKIKDFKSKFKRLKNEYDGRLDSRDKVEEASEPFKSLLREINKFAVKLAEKDYLVPVLGKISNLSIAVITYLILNMQPVYRDQYISDMIDVMEELEEEKEKMSDEDSIDQIEMYQEEVERKIDELSSRRSETERFVKDLISEAIRLESFANKVISDNKFIKEEGVYSESTAELRGTIDKPEDLLEEFKSLSSDINMKSKRVKDEFILEALESIDNKLKRVSNKYKGSDILENSDKFLKDLEENYDDIYSEFINLIPYGEDVDLYAEGLLDKVNISRIKRKAVGVPKDIIRGLIKRKRRAEKYISTMKDRRDQKLREKAINNELVPLLDDIIEFAVSAIAGLTAGTGVYAVAGKVLSGPVVNLVIINPVTAIIAGILTATVFKAGLRHRKKQRVKLAIRALEDEIDIIEEKIQDARNKGDTRTRDHLKRLQNELEYRRDEIKVRARLM